ncbi:MAG: hypothetical protein ABSH16_02465 [Sedimentisphaerales bacterium]
MKTYKIAVVPGDGTGPEVTAEAVKVINAAADAWRKAALDRKIVKSVCCAKYVQRI